LRRTFNINIHFDNTMVHYLYHSTTTATTATLATADNNNNNNNNNRTDFRKSSLLEFDMSPYDRATSSSSSPQWISATTIDLIKTSKAHELLPQFPEAYPNPKTPPP
jgi:hypothetical protein